MLRTDDRRSVAGRRAGAAGSVAHLLGRRLHGVLPLAAQERQVLLTGSGGDNWVSVGNAYAADSMRRLRCDNSRGSSVRTPGHGRPLRRAPETLLWSGGVRVLLTRSRHATCDDKARYYRRRSRRRCPSGFAPTRAREAFADTLLAERPPSLTAGSVPSNYHQSLAAVGREPVFQYEFEIGFHIESACGLRLLSPYHDRRLVRFLNAVPPEVLLLGASTRGCSVQWPNGGCRGSGSRASGRSTPPASWGDNLNKLRAATAHVWSAGALQHLCALGVVDPKGGRPFQQAGGPGIRDLLTMSAVMSADRWVGSHVSS